MLPLLSRITACLAIAGSGASAGELDPLPELEAFIDGVMDAHQDAYPYAGAVVAVVADGQIYFQKGYGVADIETGEPVDPERTLFRIGSVTKLFGWTALMQLAEQDRIDLHAPVNSYLKQLKIPDTFGEPITVAHLMNHTAGFEDRFIGLFAKSRDKVRPLAELLNAQLPERVRPPGLVTSYSNHGTALAALALENASGETWQDYVTAHILTPLQMGHTVLEQPPPDDAAMSKGYTNHNGLLKEEAFEFVPMAPAGAISATAADMARFMIAHLQYGELDGARILNEATAREMQTRSFQNAPGINGMAHGFIEMDRNGHRILGHSGDTFWFHTLWAFLPEHGIGIYASYNTDSGAQARTKLFEAFVDRYLPPGDSWPVAEADASADLRRFVGHYRSNRMAYSTLEKLGAMMGGVRVTLDEDGTLLFTGQDTMRIAEIEPLLFQEIGGNRRVRFHEAVNGEINQLYLDEIPVFAFDRTPRTETPLLHAVLLVIAFPVMLSGVIAWPAGAFRRRKAESAFSQEHLPGAAKWTAWAASVALVLFLVGFGVTMANPTQLVYGRPPQLPALLCLPLIAATLTYVAVLFALLFLARSIASRGARMHYLAVVAACATVVWQLYTWNLLGFQY